MTNVEKKKSNRKKIMFSKSALIVICLAVVLCCGIGGTLAYIVTQTRSIKNMFTAAKVDQNIEESYDGTIKSSITVTNMGDTGVYVRVKLISYRVDKSGATIGGKTEISKFTLGNDWVKIGECYYYKKPLLKNADVTSNLLGTSIELKDYSSDDKDADGGKQVIEVLSEAIQAEPKEAVTDAWGPAVANQLEDVPVADVTEKTEQLEAAADITID